jgi:hypothetical protein
MKTQESKYPVDLEELPPTDDPDVALAEMLDGEIIDEKTNITFSTTFADGFDLTMLIASNTELVFQGRQIRSSFYFP